MTDKICIVIPSLDPDEKLLATVSELKSAGFRRFVIVDDGSKKENRKFFPPEEDGIVVLHHLKNRGKGVALRTAFRYIIKNAEGVSGVITVDSDGQHRPEDVCLCAEALEKHRNAVILGCRDFSSKKVPSRSRFGNRTTSFVFRILCGMNISDTQTGLRAFPLSVLPSLLTVKGDRFEYETNMLIRLKQNRVDIHEVKISTVYIDGNASSHFKPIRDSLRVYGFIFSYALSSLISCAIDFLLFYILRRLLSSALGALTITVATVAARAVSSFTNFQINRRRVFGGTQVSKSTILKYYTVAIPQMLASAALVHLLSLVFGGSSEMDTVIKMIVDTTLFFISYRIQQGWVFAQPVKKAKVKKPARVKKPLAARTVIGRILLSFGTLLLAVLITAYSALFVIAHGPSRSLRNMLVLSAKQASATKWVPSLFLSENTVEQIMKDSEKVNTDTVDANTYVSSDSDEWDDAQDGMILEFITQPKYKAYLLKVRDPSRVSVGISSGNFKTATGGKRIFDLVKSCHAVAAINGGEFLDSGGRGSGAAPMGITYSAGKLVWKDSLKRTFIGFDKNDRLICREGMTESEANKLNIRDGVSFQTGNILIEQDGGDIKLHYSDSNTGTAQRTAIAQRADGTVLMLVTDGRSASSIGATKNDVIDILVNYGAVTAGMLDGGSSAMLYYRNYYDKYPVQKSELDVYQQQGLVNRYKAFTKPRRLPTYFIVSEEK